MKRESSNRADEVLQLVRTSSAPLPGSEQALWARLEQRLELPSFDDSSPPPGPSPHASPALRSAGSSGAKLAAQPAFSALVRVAWWATFGASMVAIGYGAAMRGQATPQAPAPEVAAHAARALPVPAPPAPPALGPALRPPAPAPAPDLSPQAAPVTPAAEVTPASEVTAAAPVATPARERVGEAPVVAPVRRAQASTPDRRQHRRRLERSSSNALADGSLLEPAPSLRGPARVEAKPDPIGLREALVLLERARAAVRLGTAGDALDWLDQLERRAAGGLLEQERLVTRALALCALREVAAARAVRERLERLDAQSIYRGQLAASCAKEE